MGKDHSIEIRTTQKDIEFFQNKKAQASIFRSKCNWSQHSEKPTKYFLNLEKKKYNKLISQLKLEDRTITNNRTKILDTMQKYYKKLYDEEGTSRLLDNENIFNTNDIPQITDSQRD